MIERPLVCETHARIREILLEPCAMRRAKKVKFCASVNTIDNNLIELHDLLCSPGVTRLSAFVRARNLPYSVDEIKNISEACNSCAQLKPKFHRPPEESLIRLTLSFERLSSDFKGPFVKFLRASIF